MVQTQHQVCNKIILSCIMYSPETYTLYGRHIQQLSHIHLRHLQAILGIKWSDRVTNNEVLQRADMPSIEAMLLSRQLTWTGHCLKQFCTASYGRQSEMLEDYTYGTWTAQSDTSTPQISTRGTGKRRPSKTEPHKLKSKDQPMLKSNDNAAMNVRLCWQIEQMNSHSSHADTAEGNWRLVLANYPMKELVRENVERFAILMSCSKPRRPPMNYPMLF